MPHHLLDLVDPGRGLHRHPVPAGRPGGAGRHRAARASRAARRGHRALPARRRRRPRHPGPLSRGGRGARGRAGRGPDRAGRPARPAGRARPGGRGAHGADQPPPGRPGPGGHPRVGAAVLDVRPGARGLPGRRPGQVGPRPRARGGRPPDRGAVRGHGRGRPGRRGAGAGGAARRHVAHGPPGARLPGDPGPRGGRRPPGRRAWRRRSGAPASSPAARPRGSAATPASRWAASSDGGPGRCWSGPWSCTAEAAPACENGAMRATKHEGAGNDFLVVLDPDDAIRFSVAQVRLLADRRRGIGADGIIRVGPGRGGCDLSMELHNADGGEAEMSGNGIRCLAQAAVDAGLVSAAPLHGGDGGRHAHRRVRAGCRARLGGRPASTWARPGSGPTSPRSSTTAGPARSTSATRTWCCSGPTPAPSTSPSSDPSCRPPSAVASTSSGSPPGATTQGELLDFRVWERGVGETLACGTGSVAAAAAARSWGAVRGDGAVRVRNPGGTLEVTLGADERRPPTWPVPCARWPTSTSIRGCSLEQRCCRAARDAHRAHLPGADHPGRRRLPRPDRRVVDEELDELAQLVDSAGADVVGRVVQRRDAPDPATFVGRGKAEEIAELSREPRRRHRRLRRRADARPSSGTWRSSSAAPPSTAPR